MSDTSRSKGMVMKTRERMEQIAKCKHKSVALSPCTIQDAEVEINILGSVNRGKNASSYFELKRLEPAADSSTAWALPLCSMLCHKHFDAWWT